MSMKTFQPQHHSWLLVCLLALIALGGFGTWFATAGVKVGQTLSGADALKHLGETNTVCGLVAGARFVHSTRGNPTYLNLDHPFPNQTCAVVIEETNRTKFAAAPEVAFTGKWVCVTGLITTNYRGSVQIPVSDPAQIVVQDAPPATPTNTTAAAPAP
ncbi:MAG TPA: hypothetical protein VMV72_14425 [Verrucomicrobiae bacterium]|nr:hypothetical protein [Verrucomicrobiae bacterium]